MGDMGIFGRYKIRRIVNDLIDELINEGVSRQDIRDLIDDGDDITDSDKEYMDIEWLYRED